MELKSKLSSMRGGIQHSLCIDVVYCVVGSAIFILIIAYVADILAEMFVLLLA